MYKIKTLNKISKKGLGILGKNYEISDDCENPDGIILRSFKMHDMELPESLRLLPEPAPELIISLLISAAKRVLLFSTLPELTQTLLKSLLSLAPPVLKKSCSGYQLGKDH